MENHKENDFSGLMTQVDQSDELARWVDEYGDFLFRYAIRYFHDQDIASDLVQETFLAACEGKARFEGRSAPRTWLVGILRHKILDQIRKKSREEKINVERVEQEDLSRYFDQAEHWTTESGPLTWAKDPDSLLHQKQFLQVLEKCLAKFPDTLRQIFLLREIEDVSREDLSRQFGLTTTNIGVMLHRIRLKLQDCLQVNWFKGARLES